MKVSEFITKLQKELENKGDVEVQCELFSITNWYSEHCPLKPVMGRIYTNKKYIIIRV